MNNKAAIYVIEMCTKMVDHYTKVINSCETMEQLNTASGWILDGFKKLHSVVENLPRRRRKLCLSAFEAAKLYVLNVSLSKGLELFGKKIDKMIFDRHPKFEQVSEKTVDDLLEAFKKMGAKVVCVKMERKTSGEDPANEQPSEKEETEKPREETGDNPPKE